MKKQRALKLTIATTVLIALAGLLAPDVGARSASKWQPNTTTKWNVGFGGDAFETGYNPTEKPPPFINGGHLASNDSDGPWLEWVSKISELPSGVFPESGLAVVDGIIYVSGAATNSFLALDAKTGLPVWRFSPDQRTDGSTASYPAANGPAVVNGVVYMPFSNGWVYALNAKTGKKIWSYQAKDGWQGKPPTIPPGNTRCVNDRCALGNDQFDPSRPAVTYTKINGALTYCDGTVAFQTLSGWAYGVDARTGKLRWKHYADGPKFPGELTWWEYPQGGALSAGAESAGGSTRRFEAVPGPACTNGEVMVPGSDGIARFFDSVKGTPLKPFDRIEGDPPHNACQDAGWNCDIAINMTIPPLGTAGGGDYLLTTLDSRIIRVDWQTHEAVWKRTYDAPLPLELEVGNSSSFLLTLPHENEPGFITEAVVGGNMALDPDIKGKGADPILYAMSQDGRLYVLAINRNGDTAAGCLRQENAEGGHGPCLLARVGVGQNKEPETPYTRRGEGGPWDFNQHALSGNVLGGNVLYVATWDNKMTAFDVRNPASPKKVWVHEIKWDTKFKYPPFGEQYKEPYVDIDNKIFSAPALVGGHLYFAANDGSVYAFNLQKKVKTVRNLVILGSGMVPFIPQWEDRLGAFDRVWTPAEWYKNQVPPAGYRLPKSAGLLGAGALLLGNVVLLWWYARRDEYEIVVEESAP
jgi:outer membrane protein assembly factor BamB